MHSRLDRGGDQPRRHAFARHVAQEQAPPRLANLEGIVKVAADATCGQRRGSTIETGNRRQHAGPHQRLERRGGLHLTLQVALTIEPRAHALQRRRKLRSRDGLQQVVGGVDRDGLERVALEGGGKDDVRPRLRQGRSQRRAPHLGHFDVEKQQVGMRVTNDRARLDRASRLADHRHVTRGLEQLSHPHARRRLIVHDHGANHAAILTTRHHRCARPSSRRRRRVSTTGWRDRRSGPAGARGRFAGRSLRPRAAAVPGALSPGPVSRTSTVSRSLVVRTITSIRPGPRVCDTPCLIAFSIRVCSIIDGT